MSTQLEQAKSLLFGKDGLGVSNFKLFPGASREATPEEVAHEINKAVEEILAGGAEENPYDCD